MTRSGRMGRVRNRTLVAWETALPTAAAVPTIPISPTPLEPIGFRCGSCSSIQCASIWRMSALTGTWCWARSWSRERVLIAGASGGVGSYAIQLASARGATVIATGLPEDVERLESLGAAEVVDYREDVAAAVLADGGKVDALLDLVSYDPETFATFAKAVRSGGKVASTSGGATPEALEKAGLTGQVVMAAPNHATLTTLLSEIKSGSLRVDIEQTLALDAATLAFEAFLAGHTRDKIVITIDR
jgi:NADPH:quinone reductase-like Zn-dependent oxidoreductase